MEPYDVIVNQPVVIDNGSGVIKAGFAGDQVKKFKRKNAFKTNFSPRFPNATSQTTLADQSTVE